MSVVLLTGCSQGGIGWHLARQFATAGCIVYASARSLNSMHGLDAHGCRLLALDVTSKEQILAAVDTIMQEQHKIDILVNNAGILAKAAVTEAGVDHFRKVLEVNFFACIELIAAVAPIMMQQQSGTIINVGSIASYTAQPFWGAYSASKSALQSATDSLRQELKPFGVKVVYCAPGVIATQLDTKSQKQGLNYVDPKGPYAVSERVKQWILNTDMIEQGTPPDVFSKGFVQMALSSTPPAHYVNGKFSWVVWLLGHFAPYSFMDGLYSKATGLYELCGMTSRKAL
eukprot:gene9318-9484_t